MVPLNLNGVGSETGLNQPSSADPPEYVMTLVNPAGVLVYAVACLTVIWVVLNVPAISARPS